MSFLLKEVFAHGKITERKSLILVITLSTENCKSEARHSCDSGCSACSEMNNNQVVSIFTPEANKYNPGDEISFKYFNINDAFMTAIAFGLPIGCSLLIVALWFFKAPEKIESLLALFSIGSGFAFGFFLIWILDNLLRKKLPATILTPPKH